ncbi:enhancer of mRNA-decapping protein 4 [Quillaja saponaria]|uniref:Enhancer of mRNA-decapping protein 4 n=1 Tax=Quillaja saponaria TaxID=32244 RepID=A0AAD7LMU3_QUISA|nr:enhancer of mRNA-decapping protein 4 [Quillaja saponaria]
MLSLIKYQPLSQAGLLLLANAKKNAIYAAHLEYGPNDLIQKQDNIAEFTVTMPILSFTGTSDVLPHGEHIVLVYCVQTQAIRQYALDLSQCLPPQLENVGLEKSDSNVSHHAISAEGFTSLDSVRSAPKANVHISSTESAVTARYPIIKAGSSAEPNVIDGKSEREAKIHDVVVNSDMGNSEIEVKVVGETRSNQNDELCVQGESQLVSDNKQKFFCSQAVRLQILVLRWFESAVQYQGKMILWRNLIELIEPLVQPPNAGVDVVHDSAKDVLEGFLIHLQPRQLQSHLHLVQKGKCTRAKVLKHQVHLLHLQVFAIQQILPMSQIIGLINNFMNKDLPAMLEKTVRKEMAAIGPAGRAITPVLEKSISSFVESFQRGVGDKAVNQLDKSVNLKLEATVARKIQAQFRTTGRQALQDSLKSSFDTSVIPAFELSCKSMFEQVDATFQKGMVEHTTAAQQHLESSQSPLAMALRRPNISIRPLMALLCSENGHDAIHSA